MDTQELDCNICGCTTTIMHGEDLVCEICGSRDISLVNEDIVIDIVIRKVVGYGYLPMIQLNDIEIYRGEFQGTAEKAMKKCFAFAESKDIQL